ncbi:restriction endonuclease subunit S [Cryobacterium glaciale]|uniref:Restriction endonuclease subunit S n=1 Tax=Cryobacterium glaciale TaxID=1259145 RepID=A0A4R8UZN3_9MICO|nr:restriction endonuclease subunit S [Cryobacterium glaciale]TFB75313.1 restriction endonuclease subunit S [Cryobacterium glaciale]
MSGSLKYSKYKPSGTQWLGEVPTHWAVTRLGRGFQLMRRPPRKEDGNLTAYRDGEVTLRSNRRLDGYTEADKEIGYQGIRVGDLVIHAMDAFAGAIGVSDSDGKSSPVYLACQPLPGHDARYFARVMRHIALSGYITSLGKGVRERSTDFRWSDARNVLVPVPPIDEQQRILAFLDRETGQIDALITKQEQLVVALTERRQAVITQAITRGLDPLIQLRDSATKWWGNIPVHWSITGLKHLVSIPITDGPHETPTFLANGVEFISASAISAGTVNFDKRRGFISAEDHALYSMKYSPRLYDIYMIKSGATTGNSAILTEDRDFSIWSPLAVLRSGHRTNPFFMHFAIQSQAFQRALTLAWTFGTQQNIGMKSIGDLQIPTPPRPEQDEIVLYLQEHVSIIDALIAKAHQVVEVLQERRQALISAAVTGKIDVRGL